jgi:1,4-dihydroxy-2-naphthoate octaprenyltransferase
LPRGHVWPALIALPLALAMIHCFVHAPRGRAFNQVLVRTVLTQLLFGLLLTVGLIV